MFSKNKWLIPFYKRSKINQFENDEIQIYQNKREEKRKYKEKFVNNYNSVFLKEKENIPKFIDHITLDVLNLIINKLNTNDLIKLRSVCKFFLIYVHTKLFNNFLLKLNSEQIYSYTLFVDKSIEWPIYNTYLLIQKKNIDDWRIFLQNIPLYIQELVLTDLTFKTPTIKNFFFNLICSNEVNPNLKKLVLENIPISNEHLNNLPKNLTHLAIINCVNIKPYSLINKFPQTIQHLSLLNNKISRNSLRDLPKDLIYLIIDTYTITRGTPRDFIFPEKLKCLILLGDDFVPTINFSCIPKFVTTIVVYTNNNFNLSIKTCDPRITYYPKESFYSNFY
jgi:hypothetical protein